MYCFHGGNFIPDKDAELIDDDQVRRSFFSPLKGGVFPAVVIRMAPWVIAMLLPITVMLLPTIAMLLSTIAMGV
jgi:hypothetical protein